MKKFTPKQRMLNAYRRIKNDRPAVAPEFWYYYPAKVLGVDMIEFERDVPFHQALKTTFEKFDCEGWGIAFYDTIPEDVEIKQTENWSGDTCLEVRKSIKTPYGTLHSAKCYDRNEPSWTTERLIKNPEQDLKAWQYLTFADLEKINVNNMINAWNEVGESYLLEAWLGVPFFDVYANDRQGGLEQGVLDFVQHPDLMERLQQQYVEYMVQKTRIICERTPFESFCLGCSWSCNSLIGPNMWRKWDKPVIKAIAQETHRHGRLLHIHFHGKCMETVSDFAEMNIDCVCPFERPPGGDIVGLEGLKKVAKILQGHTTMNGNIHTVETLIRGGVDDVRREVQEVLEAFEGNPRVIVGSGDQVGRETPEENLFAMIDEVKSAYRN